MWEETLSFTLHMAEVALVRFLVWDHDPIGRDFIGQRTVAFSSLMPGLCRIPDVVAFNNYSLSIAQTESHLALLILFGSHR